MSFQLTRVFVPMAAYVEVPDAPPGGGGGQPPDLGIWPTPPGGYFPSHPIAPGGPPPGIWPSPGHPAHPIAPGGPPPEIWPGPGRPEHPIAPGGPPPGIWPSPGFPAHPIAPGGPPPGIWPTPPGGFFPSHPIAPGGPPPGIWPSPGHPAHPIAPGGPPPGIWPDPGFPSHPIFFPPNQGGGNYPDHPIWPPSGTLPGLDPGKIPDHPDKPDLNYGAWKYVMVEDALSWGFVQMPITSTDPDYKPQEPEQGLPGSWVAVATGQSEPRALWAWIPTQEESTGPGDGLPEGGAKKK